MRLIRSMTTSAAALAVVLAAAGCNPAADVGVSAPVAESASPSHAASASPSQVESTSGSSAAASAAEAASSSSTVTPAGSDQSAPVGAEGTAWAALASLPVKGRAPKTGYDREQFGPAWADTDRNGCDTRNDILARDLAAETFKPGTQDCVVLTGVLADPYTAAEIRFVRGQGTSDDVQIDHVVALSDAWQKGAQQLSAEQRTAFANDPLNLLAVDGPANAQKGDGDAATWLPANRSFRCDYVARQVAVKAEYALWVTAAERDAMAQVLSGCPDQELPTEDTAARAYEIETRSTQSPTPAPEETYTSDPEPQPTTAETDPRFSSCAKAKAAGYGPYISGVDPEFAWYRDGDGDGTTCE
jgi:hypothetical protein